MIDGGLRKVLHAHLKLGMHWQAIETGMVAAGVPDSNYAAAGGIEGWVESKATKGWTVGLDTDQVGWLSRRARMGCRVFVAIRRRNAGGPRLGKPVDELWLFPGALAAQLRDGGLLAVPYLGRWHGGAAGWAWNEVRCILLA